MIKPVADLYLITNGNGAAYITTRDASKAVAAVGAGFKVEEFVSLENHRAAMQAEPVTPWIKCSERMPKKNDRVLIFIDFNSQYVPSSIHDAEYTGATFRRGGATVKTYPHEDGFGVTHWMPLSAAPEQEV